MDSNTTGEIVKREVELDLLKQGFKVSRVCGVMNKFDLLIEKNKIWQRVKVKAVQRWGFKEEQACKRKIDIEAIDIYATVDGIMNRVPEIEYYNVTTGVYVKILSMKLWRDREKTRL